VCGRPPFINAEFSSRSDLTFVLKIEFTWFFAIFETLTQDAPQNQVLKTAKELFRPAERFTMLT
jgi:hypothetical protein